MISQYSFWSQKVKGHVFFGLLLKNFNIGHNFLILADKAFHIWLQCYLWEDLSSGTINFEHVTLTKNFDLLLTSLIISHNFFILRDKAFIFGICVPCDQAFPMVT